MGRIGRQQPIRPRISQVKYLPALMQANMAGAGSMTATVADAIALASGMTGAGSMTASTGLTPGVIFHDACNTSANYTTTGGNTTYGGNNGMFGTLGASGSIHVAFSGSANVFEGAKKTLPSPATIFQFYYRAAAAATIGTGNTIFGVYPDATYTSSASPIRIDMVPGTTGNFNLKLIDSSNAGASVTGTTNFPTGLPLRIILTQTTAGWQIYVNDTVTAEVSYARTQGTLGYGFIGIGTIANNPAGSYTGVADFDEIWCGNMYSTQTTTNGKIADAYQSYLMNHQSAEGQPYRNPADGANGSYAGGYIDTVSEGAAYMLKLTAQQNDQASFKLTDNWILQNLLRSNSTVANTQSNAAPTTGLNLMAFKYNSANTDGKGIGTIYDANAAFDADPERAQALLWAHARWGSSALTVGIAGELATPNYLQRALNVMSDIRTYGLRQSSNTGYYYLINDMYQTGDLVQIAPDYNNPAAFKLFAQYDATNAAIWNGAISGAYDILTKTAAQVMTGTTPAQSTTASLNADWIQFTLSTGVTNGTLSTYGDSDYGYNAFRTYDRLYSMYQWYADANALAALRLPKTFFTNEWSVNAKIRATFKHDGTNTGNYESNMFNFAAYWTLIAGDAGNTTAAALNTNKIAITNTYTQATFGSYFTTAPGGNQYGYFDQSWLIENYMQQAGTWINYGQFTNAAVTSSMAGAGSITASVNDTDPATSSMSGAGSMTGAIQNIKPIASTMAGAGSMTANMATFIAANMAGAGTMAAAPGNDIDPMTASMAGSGTLTAVTSDTDNIIAPMAGAGVMGATIKDTEAIAAPMAGTGSMVGAVTETEPVAASMAGNSTMTGTVAETAPMAASMSGAGTLTATPSADTDPLNSSMSGAGVMSSSLQADVDPVAAGMAGSGTMVATMSGVNITAPMAGAGSMSGAIANTETVAAPITGAGSMSGVITETEQIAAAITGTGSMTGTLKDTESAAASMAGVGSMIAAAIDTTSATSAMAGSGVMTAPLINTEAIAAGMIGAGSMAVSINDTDPTGATMSGAGTLAAAIKNASVIAAAMAGSGSMTAVQSNTEPASSAMAGSGTLVVNTSSATTIPATSMTGSGSMTGTTKNQENVATTMSGSGSMVGTLTQTEVILAAMAGSGVMGAAVVDKTTVAAVMGGSGVMGDSVQVYLPITAAAMGAGSMSAAITSGSAEQFRQFRGSVDLRGRNAPVALHNEGHRVTLKSEPRKVYVKQI
jgi:hypothetical protein